MQIEARVGPAFGQDGVQEPPRLGRTLEMIVGHAHGRYQEAVLRGNVFCAGNSASQATSTASGTATGLILTNPVNSGRILSVLDVTVGISAAVAAVFEVGVFVGAYSVTAVTHTTALAVKNALVGSGNTGVGLADSSATLPAAPTHVRTLLAGDWLTGANGHSAAMNVKDELSGALALLPGTTISVQSVVGTQAVIAGITWEELLYTA